MEFSFVMLTWNRPRFLDASLTSLESAIADRDRSEILIVDNGSDAATKDVLARHAGQQNLRVITLAENEGLQPITGFSGRRAGSTSSWWTTTSSSSRHTSTRSSTGT